MITAQFQKRTPLEYFETFFDNNVVDDVIKYSNQYAAKRNRLGNCSVGEMKCFIAILLLSGYNFLPRKRMYRELSADVHNKLVSETLSRNIFEFLMSNLHVCNNDNLDK